MKILHIINNLATGGAEKLLMETLPLYKQKGVQADLLLLNGTDCPFLNKLKGQDCCEIFSLGKRSVYHPIHILKIIPYLKKYNLVHVHLFPALYWVAFANWFSFSKTKLVFTEHSTGNRRMNKLMFSLFDRFIYRHYHQVVCITNEVKNILMQHTSLSSDRFIIIENGINLEEIYNATPLTRDIIDPDLKESDIIIIQVAGFKEPKDQDTLIRAIALLPADIKLILVGEGTLRKKCEDFIKELQLEDRVLLLGVRNDVARLLKTSDLIVLSSKYEGLSLSSLEGLASGKPFIASNVPGLKEIAGGAGILFPVGDYKQLAKELLKLLKNNLYYAEVAKACQERAENYDIRKMVDQHIALYESIVKA